MVAKREEIRGKNGLGVWQTIVQRLDKQQDPTV